MLPLASVPLLETTILNQGLYPALKALGLLQGGLHGSRARRSPASYREKWKMRRLRKRLKRVERPIGIEPTPEPWQGLAT
jgi:hypothetical protein